MIFEGRLLIVWLVAGQLAVWYVYNRAIQQDGAIIVTIINTVVWLLFNIVFASVFALLWLRRSASGDVRVVQGRALRLGVRLSLFWTIVFSLPVVILFALFHSVRPTAMVGSVLLWVPVLLSGSSFLWRWFRSES